MVSSVLVVGGSEEVAGNVVVAFWCVASPVVEVGGLVVEGVGWVSSSVLVKRDPIVDVRTAVVMDGTNVSSVDDACFLVVTVLEVGAESSLPVLCESVVIILSTVVMDVRNSFSVVVDGRFGDVLGGALVVFGREVTSIIGTLLVVIAT